MPLGCNRNRQSRGIFRRCHRPCHWMALAVLWLCSTCWTAFAGPGYQDPYKVLGISRRASKNEIQKSYRKLCLQYHPDKNVQKTQDEQLRSETKFKMVRDAYEAILHKRGIYGGTGAKPTTAETFVRPFRTIFFVLRRPGLFWSEMKRLNLFATGSPYATVGQRNPGEIDVRSTYYQTVKVPLEKLYRGVPIFPLELKDNIFRRYWASLRGCYLFYSIYQASCIFFPLFRSNKIIAYLVGLYIVHGTTPIPDPKATYATSLQKGTWAGVRTVVFSKWRELQVVFRLQEADHPIYRRVGQDLHAQVTLTRREARRGCIKRLPPLDPAEPPIPIMISPNTYSYEKEEYSKDYQRKAQEMQSKGTAGKRQPQRRKQEERANLCPYDNTIRIPGRGWPRRMPKSTRYQRDMYRYGDLIVTINVEKPSPDEDTIIHSFPFRA